MPLPKVIAAIEDSVSRRLISTGGVLAIAVLLVTCQNAPVEQLPPAATETVAVDNLLVPEPPVIEEIVEPAEVALSPTAATASLIGLGPEDVSAMLGEPDLVRSEQETEYWIYQTELCSVHLFYYLDEDVLVYGDTGPFIVEGENRSRPTVHHVDVSLTGNGDPGEEDCVAALGENGPSSGQAG